MSSTFSISRSFIERITNSATTYIIYLIIFIYCIKLMLTFGELTRWTGVTIFELDMHLIALFATTILLVLKWQFSMAISFMEIFSPLFIACALNLYFLIIVFVRSVIEERQFRRAVINNAFHFFRTAMIAFFEVFLCYRIEGDLEHGKMAADSAYWVVLMPIWIFLIALSVHACRLL